MLKRAIKYICLVYNVTVQLVLEAVEQSEEDIFEGVQALRCDALYCTRGIADLLDFQDNQLILQDMSLFWSDFEQ